MKKEKFFGIEVVSDCVYKHIKPLEEKYVVEYSSNGLGLNHYYKNYDKSMLILREIDSDSFAKIYLTDTSTPQKIFEELSLKFGGKGKLMISKSAKKLFEKGNSDLEIFPNAEALLESLRFKRA